MYWDIDDLVRETRYSKASLEKYIICDPRMEENCDKKLLEKCRATKGQGRKRENKRQQSSQFTYQKPKGRTEVVPEWFANRNVR